MLLDILLYGLVGYFIYSLLRTWLAIKDLNNSIKDAVEIIEEQARYKMLVFEHVEQNGHNVILCFDSDNNFISQGATKEEVIEQAKQRYPKQNLATYKTEELQWIKTESEKNSENG
jgi:hypothetical protein